MAVWKAVLANGTLFWAQLLGLEGFGMESVWGAGFKVLKNVSALLWMLNISGYQPGSARQAFVVVFLCTCKCCILHAEILQCFSQTVQLCDDWVNLIHHYTALEQENIIRYLMKDFNLHFGVTLFHLLVFRAFSSVHSLQYLKFFDAVIEVAYV